MKPHALLFAALLSAAAPSHPALAQGANGDAQGFSAERLARIAGAMEAEIGKGTMPGDVALIARNGKIVYFEAHGFLDPGNTKHMPRDAVFRAFSMT